MPETPSVILIIVPQEDINTMSQRRAAKLIRGMNEKLQFEDRSERLELFTMKDESPHA